MSTLLNGRVILHDVDVEQAAAKALHAWERRTHTILDREAREDALSYLIGEAWRQLAHKFDPAQHNNAALWLNNVLSLRVTDWLRQRAGRTLWKFSGHEHRRERPRPLSLDAPTHADGDSLGSTLVDGRGDGQAAGDAATRRLLADSVRERDRDHVILREAADRIAAGRARAARDRGRRAA